MRIRTPWKTVLITLYLATAAYSHEIPTHENITRVAVDYFRRIPLFFCASDNLNSLLQVGTVDEDRYPRWVFHFLPALSLRWIRSTCSSEEWAFSRQRCRSTLAALGQVNDHSWYAALASARIADDSQQTGATITRSQNGWVELGYVVHLLEDLASPAHTRDDPHMKRFNIDRFVDPFESFNTAETPASPSGRLPPDLPDPSSFTTPQRFFTALQAYVQLNYFSNHTVFDPQFSGPSYDPPHPRNDSDPEYFHDRGGRRIAYKGREYLDSGDTEATRDKRKATINATIAREQFTELGPIVVLYVASFLRYYVDVASPAIPGCLSVGLPPPLPRGPRSDGSGQVNR